jgi:hypothetical protein
MANRMPDMMSEYVSDRISVGGDHSKKVIVIIFVISFLIFPLACKVYVRFNWGGNLYSCYPS